MRLETAFIECITHHCEGEPRSNLLINKQMHKSVIGSPNPKIWPQCENDRVQCAKFVYDLHSLTVMRLVLFTCLVVWFQKKEAQCVVLP